MNLSIIIPSASRPERTQGIELLALQLEDHDEIILVEDGDTQLFEFSKRFPKIKYKATNPTHKWGNYQRNVGMNMAQGTHLSFMDDDDLPSPSYIATIKKWVKDNQALNLFKVDHSEERVGMIWQKKQILHMNVTSQMMVIPNQKILPMWNDRYESDYWFMRACAEEYNMPIYWHEDVIVHQNGTRRELTGNGYLRH